MRILNLVVALLVGVMLGVTRLSAQIPNVGFEQWTSGEPDGWTTNNAAGFVTPITQSSTAHGGASALRGEVVSVPGFTFGPLLSAGANGKGFSVSQRHAALTGFYEFIPLGGDIMTVLVGISMNGSVVGTGALRLDASSSYKSFSVPINYNAAGNPDTCVILISIPSDSASSPPHAGSVMLVDDLAFSGIDAVVEEPFLPGGFTLEQNYPNPFNPSTTVSFGIGSSPGGSFVSLKVFDVLGREVATLVNTVMDQGPHHVVFDASRLASGVYICRLFVTDSQSGMQNLVVETKKLLLQK